MPSNLKGFDYYGCLGELKDELETVMGMKVDLVDEASLKGKIRERILKEAVSL
jgi:predicted nucleotidyltransferase